MKILITGATGLVGSALVKELLKKDHTISVATRDPEKARKNLGMNVRFISWDAEKKIFPTQELKEVEAIIHLAGVGIADRRWSTSYKNRIKNSRVIGTENLVKAIVKQSPPHLKIFISASATGIYGKTGDRECTEMTRAGSGFLSEVCQLWEKSTEPLRDRGIRKTILRTGPVLARKSGMLEKMLPLFRLGLGGRIGSGQQWVSWIHIEDLVALYIRALEDDSWNGVFNAVAPLPVTNRDFSQALGEVLEKPALVPTPAWVVKLALGEMSELVLEGNKVLPAKALEKAFVFKYATIHAALIDLLRSPAL
jgi:uncharacterized protein (TIGR01777 family)